jgi:hypothetical protein
MLIEASGRYKYEKLIFLNVESQCQNYALLMYYTSWLWGLNSFEKFMNSHQFTLPQVSKEIVLLKDSLRFEGVEHFIIRAMDTPAKYELMVYFDVAEYLSIVEHRPLRVEFSAFQFNKKLPMNVFAQGLIRDLLIQYMLQKKVQIHDDFTDQCLRVLI